jgi:hypothetical protein
MLIKELSVSMQEGAAIKHKLRVERQQLMLVSLSELMLVCTAQQHTYIPERRYTVSLQ